MTAGHYFLSIMHWAVLLISGNTWWQNDFVGRHNWGRRHKNLEKFPISFF
jgi:hypothetical protein